MGLLFNEIDRIWHDSQLSRWRHTISSPHFMHFPSLMFTCLHGSAELCVSEACSSLSIVDLNPLSHDLQRTLWNFWTWSANVPLVAHETLQSLHLNGRFDGDWAWAWDAWDVSRNDSIVPVEFDRINRLNNMKLKVSEPLDEIWTHLKQKHLEYRLIDFGRHLNSNDL